MDSKCWVTVAKASNVRKPKGGKPGQALVVKEAAMVGKPSAVAIAAERKDP